MRTYKMLTEGNTLGDPAIAIPQGRLFQHDGKKTLVYGKKSASMALSTLEFLMDCGWFVPTRASAAELAALSGCAEDEIHEMEAPTTGRKEVSVPEPEEPTFDVVEEDIYEDTIPDAQGDPEDFDMDIPEGCDIELAPNPSKIKDPAPKKVKPTTPAPKKAVKTVEPEPEMEMFDEGDEDGEANEVLSFDDDMELPEGITMKGSDENSGSEEVISFSEPVDPSQSKSKPASERKITKQKRPTKPTK